MKRGDLPERCVLVMLSNMAGDRKQTANSDMCLTMLRGKGLEPEVLDASDPESIDFRNELFEKSGVRGNYPQVFKISGDETTFVGDFDTIQGMNEEGSLQEFSASISPDNIGSEQPVKPVRVNSVPNSEENSQEEEEGSQEEIDEDEESHEEKEEKKVDDNMEEEEESQEESDEFSASIPPDNIGSEQPVKPVRANSVPNIEGNSEDDEEDSQEEIDEDEESHEEEKKVDDNMEEEEDSQEESDEAEENQDDDSEEGSEADKSASMRSVPIDDNDEGSKEESSPQKKRGWLASLFRKEEKDANDQDEEAPNASDPHVSGDLESAKEGETKEDAPIDADEGVTSAMRDFEARNMEEQSNKHRKMVRIFVVGIGVFLLVNLILIILLAVN